MRIDHQAAISALKRALEMLRVPASSNGDFVARLFDLTTVLFENELSAAALASILGERTGYDENVERCRRLAIAQVGPQLRAFFAEVRGMWHAFGESPDVIAPAAFGTLPAYMRQTFAGDERRVTGPARTHEELFDVLADDAGVQGLDVHTLLELHKIREVGGRVRRILDQAARRLDAVPAADLAALETAESKLESAIGAIVASLRFAEELMRGASLQPLVDRLWELHLEMRALLDASGVFPFATGSALLPMSWSASNHALIGAAERIVSLVEYRLQAGTVEQHALVRLRSFLERFGRDRLLADFDRQKHSASGRRQLERQLQQHVDRFLFSEGLFPITHAEASGGPIDTFLDASEHLFAEVRGMHQLPVLLELKAQVRDKTTKAKVRAKAKRALEQAAIYSSHMRAKPSWRAHNVTALVAYDGPARYRTDRPDLMLVYLGDAPPSKGAAVLELEVDAR